MNNGYFNEIIETIQDKSYLFPRGGMTKTGILTPQDADTIDMSALSGIREYNPSEYTFTALAGTKLTEINQMLTDNGQFLPFDPPLATRGATLGGTVGANLSGPMRYYYGGVRDFILGVQFLNDQGQLVRSGGKVVKNAAGFDIPKLMVGSFGSLGPMVEISFKVFPRHEGYITLVGKYPNLSQAWKALIDLTLSPVEILSLELVPRGSSFSLQIRLGGDPRLFQERINHLGAYLQDVEYFQGEEELENWKGINEYNWVPEGSSLIKVPLIPKLIPELDAFLEECEAVRRYSAGGNIAWIAWSNTTTLLDQKLLDMKLMGLTILGPCDQVRFGLPAQNVFFRKIKAALDPSGLWVEV